MVLKYNEDVYIHKTMRMMRIEDKHGFLSRYHDIEQPKRNYYHFDVSHPGGWSLSSLNLVVYLWVVPLTILNFVNRQ